MEVLDAIKGPALILVGILWLLGSSRRKSGYERALEPVWFLYGPPPLALLAAAVIAIGVWLTLRQLQP